MPGAGTACPPCPLLGRRFANPGDLEASSCPMAVQNLLLGPSSIHHIPDPLHQSRLCQSGIIVLPPTCTVLGAQHMMHAGTVTDSTAFCAAFQIRCNVAQHEHQKLQKMFQQDTGAGDGLALRQTCLPGMVRDVSATLVATMMRRWPEGTVRKTASWAPPGSIAYSGSTCTGPDPARSCPVWSLGASSPFGAGPP